MSGRPLAAVCIAAVLAGCAATSYEGAVRYETSANRIGPSPDALASRGYDAYNRSDYIGASAYFEEALALDPDNAFALKGLDASRDGVRYFGDRRPMRRDTEAAIRRVLLDGYDAYDRGDMAGAGARFRTILAVDPGNADALEGLETIRRKAGERTAIEGATASTMIVDPVATGEPGADYLPVGSYELYETADGDAGGPPPAMTPEEAIAGWTIPPETYR